MCKVYGYCRKSTAKQKIERQIENIVQAYPDAIIVTESYSGTTMDRPEWNKLLKKIKIGDTIVFDEVSRMARNAAEGFETYKQLFDKGIHLVFLKESTLNTANFRNTMQVAMTGTEVDLILEGVNKYLMVLAENQIRTAFETAQHEVDFLHQRTSEGIREARRRGKQIGRAEGSTITTKKSIQAKEIIKKHSKDFGGTLNDADVIKLAGVSRNSYYKYKSELKKEEGGR